MYTGAPIVLRKTALSITVDNIFFYIVFIQFQIISLILLFPRNSGQLVFGSLFSNGFEQD